MNIKKLVLREHGDNGMNDFRVEGVRGNVSLWKDYNKEGDGIYWGMQGAGILKKHYTEQDELYRLMMNKYVPLKKDEIVIINDEIYKIKILGNYSDCCIFEKVE